MNPAVFIVIIIVVVASIFIGAQILERRRRKDLEIVANELGLEFKPDGDASLQNRLSRYELFNTGRSRKLTNLVEGVTDEVSIAIFDYKYTTGGGKNQHTARQTVVSLESPNLVIPNFSMRPENLLDKIGSVLGFQDIDFESHPKFSMMFVLKADNEEAVRNFFTPDILEFFETKSGFSVEANLGGALIFYRPRKREKANQLKNLLTQAYEVFGIMVDRSSKA